VYDRDTVLLIAKKGAASADFDPAVLPKSWARRVDAYGVPNVHYVTARVGRTSESTEKYSATPILTDDHNPYNSWNSQ